MSDLKQWISIPVFDIPMSGIKEMAILGAQTEGAVSLAWGLPAFRTPAHIRAAVADALEHDRDLGKYALPSGMPALRELIAEKHHERTDVFVDPDENVLVTAGNMQGMNTLFRATLNPGDEVIVTDPGFPSHTQQIRIHGGRPVHWALDEGRDWAMDLASLSALITDRTKAIVLVNPANPTGSLFPEEALLALGDVAIDRGILVFMDDPYSHFVYGDEARHFNLASHARLTDHLVYLFTFSKIHAMSGWRLGYMIMPSWLRNAVLKVHDATMICAPRVSQVAGIAAMTEQSDHMSRFKEIMSRHRTLICERLDRLPHVFEYVRPAGAYYVFPRILVEHENSREFAMQLCKETKVAVTPGSAFGPSGEHHVRMAYCVDEPTIQTAFDRLEAAFPA